VLVPGNDQMLFGDPERLYQAFRNLLGNAIKYTPDGGRIIVDGRTQPGFIEVSVVDTGIGSLPKTRKLSSRNTANLKMSLCIPAGKPS
jgi:signal transduction histidine kinase